MPPAQSLLHTHVPEAASHSQADGAQPCDVSHTLSVGHPLTTQPAGLAPAHAAGAHSQISQPSSPVRNPFSQ